MLLIYKALLWFGWVLYIAEMTMMQSLRNSLIDSSLSVIHCLTSVVKRVWRNPWGEDEETKQKGGVDQGMVNGRRCSYKSFWKNSKIKISKQLVFSESRTSTSSTKAIIHHVSHISVCFTHTHTHTHTHTNTHSLRSSFEHSGLAGGLHYLFCSLRLL